jgi:hypothetical protein
LSALPGGLPAMAALAEEMDGEPPVVAAIHFLRLVTILISVPIVAGMLPMNGGAGQELASVDVVGPLSTVASLLVGAAGAWVARRLRIPTGEIVGSIVALSVARLVGLRLGPLAGEVRIAAMLVMGLTTGVTMTRHSLRLLAGVLPAALLAVGLMLVLGFGLGWLLALVTPLDVPTALFSAVPGGASTMPLVAQDAGGDLRLVAALHLLRQLAVFIVLPALVARLVPRSQAESRQEEAAL